MNLQAVYLFGSTADGATVMVGAHLIRRPQTQG